MKTKLRLVFLLSVFGNPIWAQNGIGVSYSMRVFPFQQHNNEENPYLYSKNFDSDKVITSAANEHTIYLYFQKENLKNGRTRQFGLNVYSARLDFSRKANHSNGNQDVWGSSYTGTTDVKSGTYDYCFIGASYSSLKIRTTKLKFSVVTGITGSMNFLSWHALSNKRHTTNTTSSVTSWNGSAYETHSNTTTSKDENIPDPQQLKFNLKMEFPFYLRYSTKRGTIHFGGNIGVSTQSRVLVNDVGLNLFASPTIGYTYFLK